MMNGGWPHSQGGNVMASGLGGGTCVLFVKEQNYVLHLAILCLWTGSSTFQKFVGGKG